MARKEDEEDEKAGALDEEIKRLQLENLRVTNEHLKEQTQFYREQNEQLRGKREMKDRNHAKQEETLRINRANLHAIQANCTHQKGGKGDDLLKNAGSDPNHCTIKHTVEWGETMVKCIHAWNAWRNNETTDLKYHPAKKIPAVK